MNSPSSLLNVYRRTKIVMDCGKGVYLYDIKGKKYLDLAAGIAVNSLGHNHPAIVNALKTQSEKLWHCSNYFHTEPLDQFAAELTKAAKMDQVFFCSSGTEAVETAIKMMRRYFLSKTPPLWGSRNFEAKPNEISVRGQTSNSPHASAIALDSSDAAFPQGESKKMEIIVAESAFHGRTLGALSACGHEKSREGFGKLLDGFVTVPFNDAAALEKAITKNTAGILLETIQGEGGVRPHSAKYLQKARALADQHDLAFALDEVQCGYGRTGTLYAYEESGIQPDILVSAKGIGGGFPLAAALVKNRVGAVMAPGSHGSTYGSNPLACAVGHAVLNEILKKGFLNHVQSVGKYFRDQLHMLSEDFPLLFSEVTGSGLMLGLGLVNPDIKSTLNSQLLEHGLIVAPAVTAVLRLLPSLTLEREHVDEAISIFRQVAKTMPVKTSENAPSHFLDLKDIPPQALREILSQARTLKSARKDKKRNPLLEGNTLGMIFEKNSTRTRVSFEVAMFELGGHALYLSSKDLQLGRGETIADTARVLSRYVDALMIRADKHETLEELASYATVPVINGLTDKAHPCQVMADILTIEEKRGDIVSKTIAWVGDGNNMANSWIAAAVQFGFTLRLACPKALAPSKEYLDFAKERKAAVTFIHSPEQAVRGADVVVTDTWVSMSQEDSTARKKTLAPYQVNQVLMQQTSKDALFLHCLPAHRGEEVTDEVIDGEQSAVWDEAENRLHVQKAIILWCLQG